MKSTLEIALELTEYVAFLNVTFYGKSIQSIPISFITNKFVNYRKPNKEIYSVTLEQQILCMGC